MTLKSGQQDVGENTPYRQSRTQVLAESFAEHHEAQIEKTEASPSKPPAEMLKLNTPKRAANYLSAAEAAKAVTSRSPSSNANQPVPGRKIDSSTRAQGARVPKKQITGISIESRNAKDAGSVDGKPALSQQLVKRNSTTTKSAHASYGHLKVDRKVVLGGRQNRFGPTDSKRRVAQNMPLCNNTKAKNNLAVQTNQFVDSDFYDSHSVHQGTPKP